MFSELSREVVVVMIEGTLETKAGAKALTANRIGSRRTDLGCSQS